MKKLKAQHIGIVFILFFLSIAMIMSVAQESRGLPPLPVDLTIGQVLFPQAIHQGIIEPDSELIYVFVAYEAEPVQIEFARNEGDFVPYLAVYESLSSLEKNDPLYEQAASDLAGRRARLQFDAPESQWYFVRAGNDPAEGGDDKTGTFDLILLGTTSDSYSYLNYVGLSLLNGIKGRNTRIT